MLDDNQSAQNPPANGESTVSAGTRFVQKRLGKMGIEEFLSETSEDFRAQLKLELSFALRHFIDLNRAIYLDAFGILIPQQNNQRRIEHSKNNSLIQETLIRGVSFEKCLELSSSHYKQFPAIAELRELAQNIFKRNPALCSDEFELKRRLRAYIEFIKRQTIIDGISNELDTLGIFYALHNRQGLGFSNWFAGADVFFKSLYQKCIETQSQKTIPRPVLHSAAEVFEALYGKPLACLRVDLVKELNAMGYDGNRFKEESRPEERCLSVYKFLNDFQTKSDAKTYIYCSDGMRSIARQQGSSLGSEAILQLEVRKEVQLLEENDLECVARIFTMAWILLQSSPTKNLKIGSAMSASIPSLGNKNRSFNSILCTPFKLVRTEQLCEDGPFNFVNVLTITDDEAHLIECSSATHLLALLEHRNIDQVSSLSRPSLLLRSEFSFQQRILGRELEAKDEKQSTTDEPRTAKNLSQSLAVSAALTEEKVTSTSINEADAELGEQGAAA